MRAMPLPLVLTRSGLRRQYKDATGAHAHRLQCSGLILKYEACPCPSLVLRVRYLALALQVGDLRTQALDLSVCADDGG
eukprot:246228-Chlamydomonas_euryale.AAC.1